MQAEPPIRCYVINLDRSKERLEHMSRVLGAARIEFVRSRAVDAEHVAKHPSYSLVPALRGRNWTAGEIACLLSHYDVWTQIARGPDQFAAVFEDDLHIDPRLRDILLPGSIPRDADIVKLETVNIPVAVSRWQIAGPSGVRFARLLGLHHGAGAYLMSRAAARRAVDSLHLFDLPVDDAIFGPRHSVGRTYRSYQVIPALAIQDVVLPKERRAPELASQLEPERKLQSVHSPGEIRRPRPTDRLFPVHNLPVRIVRAAWRRIDSRYAAIPYSGLRDPSGRAK